MYLLIDECCSDGLRTVAEKLGHVAQLTKHVAGLGRGQDDAVLFDFARAHGAVLVTVNAADFRDLARYRDHPGVILVPSVREPRQSRLFRRVRARAAHADAALAVDDDPGAAIRARGRVRAAALHALRLAVRRRRVRHGGVELVVGRLVDIVRGRALPVLRLLIGAGRLEQLFPERRDAGRELPRDAPARVVRELV